MVGSVRLKNGVKKQSKARENGPKAFENIRKRRKRPKRQKRSKIFPTAMHRRSRQSMLRPPPQPGPRRRLPWPQRCGGTAAAAAAAADAEPFSAASDRYSL